MNHYAPLKARELASTLDGVWAGILADLARDAAAGAISPEVMRATAQRMHDEKVRPEVDSRDPETLDRVQLTIGMCSRLRALADLADEKPGLLTAAFLRSNAERFARDAGVEIDEILPPPGNRAQRRAQSRARPRPVRIPGHQARPVKFVKVHDHHLVEVPDGPRESIVAEILRKWPETAHLAEVIERGSVALVDESSTDQTPQVHVANSAMIEAGELLAEIVYDLGARAPEEMREASRKWSTMLPQLRSLALEKPEEKR